MWHNKTAAMNRTAVLAVAALALSASSAQARTFGGFECQDDCSGHAAGYRWAEERGIDSADECPTEQDRSFREGCLAFVDDPDRGAEDDDSGEPIGK